MRLLAGLQCVDWVVSFSELTPLRLIRELQPDVLVKGHDYAGAWIVGSEHVEVAIAPPSNVPYHSSDLLPPA